jgi:hypothetical protein
MGDDFRQRPTRTCFMCKTVHFVYQLHQWSYADGLCRECSIVRAQARRLEFDNIR